MGMQEHGYAVLSGSPVESFTTSGAEAVVKYIGPSLTRVDFIRDVFGAWNIVTNNIGTELNPIFVQCAQMVPPASPYPYPTVIDADGGCTGLYCLWPDTFTGQPSDENSIPNLWNDPQCDVENDLLRPIVDTCAWEYTVNYRYKNNGRLPAMLQQDPRVGPNPPIPLGTYTDVRITTSNEWMNTQGRHWKYDENSYGTDEDWAFCPQCANKPAATKITSDGKSEVEQFTEVNSIDIEVIWDNVPLPPWDIIRRANGCVNEFPIFGFPRHSVKFEFGEPEVTGYFGCQEIYRLRFMFKVKTAQITWRNDDSFDTNYNDGEVINGTIGVWNRRWCSCPIKLGATSFFTNWVPLAGITDETTGECVGESGTMVTRPFQSFPLQLLFAMNVCNCSLTDLAEGDCTIALANLSIDRVKADGNKWRFDNMSLTTAQAFAAAGIGTIVA